MYKGKKNRSVIKEIKLYVTSGFVRSKVHSFGLSPQMFTSSIDPNVHTLSLFLKKRILKLSQNYPYNTYLSRFGDVKVHKPIQDGFVSGSVEIHGESLRIFDRIV